MITEQAIQDVAMIARNGIDRVIELERENKRLTECLLKANSQAEHFEREWYLRGDEVERLRKLSDEMYSTITAAMLLTPHECGAYGVLETAIVDLKQCEIFRARCVVAPQFLGNGRAATQRAGETDAAPRRDGDYRLPWHASKEGGQE